MATTPTPVKRWTKAQVQRFVADAFQDRIAWKASRTLLERAKADPAFGSLAPELRASIERFLDLHP